jgi:geranylgeranyl transferase type-2 subunit beta
MENYLQYLNTRLADNLARTPAELRNLHGTWLAAQQNPDGGFSGREGDSDLYYTGFALRGLSVLDALTPEICEKSTNFLRSCLTRQTSVVDFFSFLYACLLLQISGGPDVLAEAPADWPRRVADTLETFRTKDNGYNKSPGANSGSTYHTFLVGLCYQLLGQPFPRPQEVEQFIRSRRREDGGFVEVAPMRRSGTNPTAAAIGTLHLLHGLKHTDADTQAAADFIAQMGSDEGGLRANDRIPLADLLSTFTGMWTLELLGGLDRINRNEARNLVLDLALPNGGFKGGLWDEATDVEYTFYGLGTLALLQE